MNGKFQEYDVELSWIDLLLKCIEVGISPEEVRDFLRNYMKE